MDIIKKCKALDRVIQALANGQEKINCKEARCDLRPATLAKIILK